jgi:hypothetical protein
MEFGVDLLWKFNNVSIGAICFEFNTIQIIEVV